MTCPETSVTIKKYPFMGFIFLKALLVAPFRPNTIKNDAVVNKTSILLKNFLPDRELIKRYKQVCSFPDNRPDTIPISYLQTVFTGLLGKFITSSFFPLNPLGLIHIFQSFEQSRPVATNEILDLACTLKSIKKTEKGIETAFNLKVVSHDTLVWHGRSIFLTKRKEKRKEKKEYREKKNENILEKKEFIPVPSDIGRKYANVSGDYNPHHLYPVMAHFFGFKKTIAHGMWSLARAIASLEKEFYIHNKAAVEASFKLPIFMPATITLGYESQDNKEIHGNLVNFELRDMQKGRPHLKGTLRFSNCHDETSCRKTRNCT